MKNIKGFSIIELVIASAIIAVFLSAVVLSFSSFLKFSSYNIRSIKATFLAEETIEVVKFLKNSDWETYVDPLNSNQDYYLSFDGSLWAIVSIPNMVDEFERKFILEDVDRDAEGEIVESGTLDLGTKKITALVSWFNGNATSTKTISTYISNI